MGEKYSLTLLKLEKDRVNKHISHMTHLKESGSIINERELTKYKHQLYDLDYAIELLQDHFNDEA